MDLIDGEDWVGGFVAAGPADADLLSGGGGAERFRGGTRGARRVMGDVFADVVTVFHSCSFVGRDEAILAG